MEDRIRLLLNKYVHDTASRQELEEFFALIRDAENDEHLRSMIRGLYDQIREEDDSVPSYVDEDGNLVFGESALSFTLPPNKPRKNKWAVVAIAACLLAVAIPGYFWIKNKPDAGSIASNEHHQTKKTTDRSEYRYILLPDSTQVWLNASSTLEFPDQFKGPKREVVLSGEAYFDVKHAEDIPFIIHTGEVATTVLGTAFNIKAYPGFNDVIVSVSRGKVKVTRGGQLLATLTKGQQVKVGNKTDEITKKLIEENDVAAWQKGKLVYDDERFEEIVTNLKQIYNADVRIENAFVRNLKVSTSFSRESGIEHALEVLCKLTDSQLQESGGIYYIR